MSSSACTKAASPFRSRRNAGLKVHPTGGGGAARGRDFRGAAGHQAAGGLREGHRAESDARARRCCSRTGSRFISKPIVPPKNVNVILVAPKGPGHIVRRQYTEGKGVPALIAVYQNPSKAGEENRAGVGQRHRRDARGRHRNDVSRKRPRRICSANKRCCAAARARWCRRVMKSLVEAGYQPEMAYFECLHELKLIVDLMNEAGISGMRFSISETAKWGDVSVGPKIIDASVKKRMKAALKDIQSGKFAKGWVAEYKGGYKKYNALLKKGEKHPIEKVGARLRGMMPWMKKRPIKGVQAAY